MIPPLYRGQSRRVCDRQRHEYERLKAAIYERLRRRPDFDKGVDSALIDVAARLFATWLHIEGILSSPEGQTAVWKYADALAKIHSMLIPVLEELRVTPKMRQNIAQDLVDSDDITKRLQKLLEGK